MSVWRDFQAPTHSTFHPNSIQGRPLQVEEAAWEAPPINEDSNRIAPQAVAFWRGPLGECDSVERRASAPCCEEITSDYVLASTPLATNIGVLRE